MNGLCLSELKSLIAFMFGFRTVEPELVRAIGQQFWRSTACEQDRVEYGFMLAYLAEEADGAMLALKKDEPGFESLLEHCQESQESIWRLLWLTIQRGELTQRRAMQAMAHLDLSVVAIGDKQSLKQVYHRKQVMEYIAVTCAGCLRDEAVELFLEEFWQLKGRLEQQPAVAKLTGLVGAQGTLWRDWLLRDERVGDAVYVYVSRVFYSFDMRLKNGYYQVQKKILEAMADRGDMCGMVVVNIEEWEVANLHTDEQVEAYLQRITEAARKRAI